MLRRTARKLCVREAARRKQQNLLKTSRSTHADSKAAFQGSTEQAWALGITRVFPTIAGAGELLGKRYISKAAEPSI